MTDISDDAVPQDPMAAIRQVLDRFRFAEIAREEAKRTVYVADMNAVDAATAEAIQSMGRRWPPR